jgi:hypothetical protein
MIGLSILVLETGFVFSGAGVSLAADCLAPGSALESAFFSAVRARAMLVSLCESALDSVSEETRSPESGRNPFPGTTHGRPRNQTDFHRWAAMRFVGGPGAVSAVEAVPPVFPVPGVSRDTPGTFPEPRSREKKRNDPARFERSDAARAYRRVLGDAEVAAFSDFLFPERNTLAGKTAAIRRARRILGETLRQLAPPKDRRAARYARARRENPAELLAAALVRDLLLLCDTLERALSHGADATAFSA